MPGDGSAQPPMGGTDARSADLSDTLGSAEAGTPKFAPSAPPSGNSRQLVIDEVDIFAKPASPQRVDVFADRNPATPPVLDTPAPTFGSGRGEGTAYTRTTTEKKPRAEKPEAESSGRGQIWRVIAIIASLAAALLVVVWLRQGLAAAPSPQQSEDDGSQPSVAIQESTGSEGSEDSDDADSNIDLPLNDNQGDTGELNSDPSTPFSGSITVVDFDIGDSMTVGVLSSDIRNPVSPDTPTVDVAVPAGVPTIVGLWEDDTLRGMTIVNQPESAAGPDQDTISPATTAQTLVVLYPGVLSTDLETALNRSAQVREAPEFVQLSDAVRDRSGINTDTPDVAISLAVVVNQLTPPPNTPVECSSNVPDAVAEGGGLCFGGDEPPTVTNETTRWTVLVDAASQAFICGAVAPRSQGTIPQDDQCGPSQLVIGPGPLSDADTSSAERTRAVAVASGLHAFAEYGLVLNDLVLGSDSRNGSTDDATLVTLTPTFAEQLISLTNADPKLATAAETMGAADVDAGTRVRSIIALTQAIMTSETPSIADQTPWAPDSFGMQVTELFDTSAEWVSPQAGIPGWNTAAVTEVDVTGAG